jgi:undecaprenyl diphosphate synthase
MSPVKHVAIIMDGNGRWGIKHKKSRNAGHRAGLNTVEIVINECIDSRINYLTLYAFSTENWKRPKKEVDFLFNLLETFLSQKIQKLIDKKIKLKFIGDKKKLPLKLKNLLKVSELKTANFNKLQVNIALNYGSKIEILNAIKLVIKKKKSITEKNIEDSLYTRQIPNPELLIRTGDTKRLSNFLLWQLAYTEIFFEKKLWPDFKKYDFKKILKKFSTLKRNFGSI